MESLQDTMNAPQRENGSGFAVTMVHYSKLVPSETNNYSVGNIEGLAQAILLAGGVKHNLLAREKTPDEYELISGHRRRLAVKYITEEMGVPGYEMLPVRVEKEGDLQAEVELILTNCSARERSDWEKMMEVDRLTELMTAMQGGTDEERDHFREIFGAEPGVTARELRRMVADKLGLSETRVANYNHINNSLVPELMTRFQAGEIGVTVANEAASLPEEDQRALAGQQDIRIADVRGMRPVSESDTEEQLPGQMEISDFPEFLPPAAETGQISVADMAAAGDGLVRTEYPVELDMFGCANAFWCSLYTSERGVAERGQLSELLKILKTEHQGDDSFGPIDYVGDEHKIEFTDTLTGASLTCTWSELAISLIENADKFISAFGPDQPAAPESIIDSESSLKKDEQQQKDREAAERQKQLEAESARPEPSEKDIAAFYRMAGFDAQSNINAESLKSKYRDSGGGYGSSDLKLYWGSARGIRINGKKELTYSQLAKRLKEYQEKQRKITDFHDITEPVAAGTPEQEPDQEPDGTRAKDLEAAGWYDETILTDMIKWETKMLEDISECGVDDDHIAVMYAKRHMTVEALKTYLDSRRQQADSWEERRKAQKPMPRFKNDDERKAWIDNYLDWPVWFEVPQADQTYYRYDLPDGDSLVARKEKYYNSWMEKYTKNGLDPDSIRLEYYIIQPGYHYLADCAQSKTELINKLKKIKNLI